MRIAFLACLPLIALAASAAPAQNPAVVEVHLSNFKFTPQAIVLDHGQSYVLKIIDESSGGHNFTAKSFFAAANVTPRDRALIGAKGNVEVSGGEAREIHFVAPAAGSYDVKCTHFLHESFGMKGSITVR